MKKLTRKLFLSVAALAVCAATLVSTTFAWYVSNSKATVSGVAGSTAGTEVSGNLLVAENTTTEGTDKAGAYTQDLVLTINGGPLQPVTKATAADDANNVEIGDWVDKEGKAAVESDKGKNYMQVKFWVMSTKAQAVNFSYEVTNKTDADDVKKQKAYTATGAPVAQGTEFAVDAVNALRMNITATAPATSGGENINADLGVAETATIKTAAETTALFTANSTGDANKYYQQLLGKIPYGCEKTVDTVTTAESPAAPNTDVETVYLAANTEVLMTITIWLEGTDKDCFDSCISQAFDFKFIFEVPGGSGN